MKTLIIGATGNIGGLTAGHLIAKSTAVDLRLISSRAEGCEALRESFPQAEVLEANLYHEQTLLAALDGIDRIFMNVPDMLDERRATPNLISALASLKRRPHILRFCAFPPHKSLQDLTEITQASGIGAAKHYIAKQALDASGLDVTFLNAPCWFMTNLPWLSADALRDFQCLNIPHQHSTPWISPNDIGEAAASLLLDDKNNLDKEYAITGPEVFDFTTVAALMSSIFEREIRYDPNPEIFRRYFGDMTDAMLEYFAHSKIDYGLIEPTNTLEKILKRRPESLASWLRQNKGMFGF